jgi:hypothetical protein
MKNILLAASAVMLIGSLNSARADVVTFDDATGNSLLFTPLGFGQSFSDQGLTFTNFGQEMYIWDGSSPNSNGTNNNILGFDVGDYEQVTKTGGGPFTLNSVQLAISWYDPNPAETILVNGAPLTITQTLTTYNLNLADVTSVDISGLPSGTGYWTADNFVFNNPVPEPASLLLLGAGLSALGLVRRRQN